MINGAIALSNEDSSSRIRRQSSYIHAHTLARSVSLSLPFLSPSRFHLSLILTGFFCHSLSFLPFSIKLSMSFFASRQWWRLAIHHLLSGGNAARLSSLSFSLVSLRSLLFAFSRSLFYSSRRLLAAKSVVVMHPTERQLLNIPVLLFFLCLPWFSFFFLLLPPSRF